MAKKIQLRRDTAATLALANPILAQGEPALEIDTKKEKIGDGVTAWNSLPYRFTGGDGGGIPDAPANGKIYARMNNQWVEITGVTPIPSSIVFEIVGMEVIAETDPNITMAISNGDLIINGYQGSIDLVDGELILN